MEKLQLPVQRFAAEFASQTANSDDRTMEMTWQTGAQMDRYGWDGKYQLTLSMDPAHVRMGRLSSGSAPLLNNHSSYDLHDVIGVIESASVSGGKGTARVRFSARPDVQPIFDDVKAGIIRNASVGAAIHKMKDVTPQQKDENGPRPMKQYLAVDWEPMEISAVPIGADPGARFAAESITKFECEIEPLEVLMEATRATAQRENEPMDETTITAGAEKAKPVEQPAVAAAAVDIEAVKAEATKAERARVAGINQKCKLAGMTEEFAQSLVDEGVTLGVASDRIFAKMGEQSQGNTINDKNPRASIERDGQQTKCEAVVSALLHRYDGKAYQLREDAREYRGMSLLRIAEDFVSARGVNTRGMNRDTLAARALERENFAGGYEGTTDFPGILADVANKTLRQAYQQTQRTFVNIFRQTTASDFKNLNRAQLSEAPALVVVGPSGEFKTGAMTDSKETYRLLTYGRIVSLNRQTIVNDDLDAFSRVPAGYGMQAANLESDIVWGIITANAALADNVALFHATHRNVVASGGGVPDVTQVSALRKLLRQQKGLDGATLLNIIGKYLVVPSALETAAEQLVAVNIPLVPVTTGTSIPQWFRSLTPVVEPRLDASSAVMWYLFADYGQVDTVEYAYLEGQEGVYIETRMGFNVDGMEIKARLDFGAKAIDFRGMARNAGA